MPQYVEQSNIQTLKVNIRRDKKNEFVDWQSELNAYIAAFPGFVSLEIVSPLDSSQYEWIIVQRFIDSTAANAWNSSAIKQGLLNNLKTLAADNGIEETLEGSASLKGGVTEVFITQVSPDRDDEYKEWIAKIHRAEAKFPGFRGVYVQSPTKGQGRNWITFLQFDTPNNLDSWLESPERQEVLKESQSLIKSLESQRVISSYGGWFSSLAKIGDMPPVWKQTMLVLLVLFPIVMLELKFLPLIIGSLNSSLSTFIGNAISVTLIAWPMMPIAIYCLSWWLAPKDKNATKTTILGLLVVLGLYLIEIAVFWNLLG